MQKTQLVRRVLGDLIGGVTLAALLASLMYELPTGTTSLQIWHTFVPIYAALGIGGYVAWLQLDKQKHPQWLKQALISVAVGFVFLLLDVIFGHYHNPSVPILRSAPESGLMFGITLLVCPGYTFIALSGWLCSLAMLSGQ